MIGNKYWSTGIVLRADASRDPTDLSWSGYLEYFDDGFANDDLSVPAISTQGRLRTRYMVRPSTEDKATDPLTAVIDTLIADAKKLGIWLREPTLYYQGDGEDKSCPPPDGWRELLRKHSDRIGWSPALY